MARRGREDSTARCTTRRVSMTVKQGHQTAEGRASESYKTRMTLLFCQSILYRPLFKAKYYKTTYDPPRHRLMTMLDSLSGAVARAQAIVRTNRTCPCRKCFHCHHQQNRRLLQYLPSTPRAICGHRAIVPLEARSLDLLGYNADTSACHAYRGLFASSV